MKSAILLCVMLMILLTAPCAAGDFQRSRELKAKELNPMIIAKTDEVFEYVVTIRRRIHMNPEPAFNEYETARLIEQELDNMKIAHRKGVAGTGIVAVIEGGMGAGKVLAIRADMDALPIVEQTDLSFTSKKRGFMHACGHDSHTAMLLGTAKIMNSLRDQFPGALKLIFQPAEEEGGGARPMIESGALKNPDVDAIIACHVQPSRRTGEIGVTSGPVKACSRGVKITIEGRGGHAAYPQLCVDPVLLSGQFITMLQSIVSRRVDPRQAAVITIGAIHGGDRGNVIPQVVEMKGTMRCYDDALMKSMENWTEDLLKSVVEPAGGRYTIQFSGGYPAVINDAALTKRVQDSLRDLQGNLSTCVRLNAIPMNMSVSEALVPSMGSEDFSYYGREVPACMMELGTGGKNGEFSLPLHHPAFAIDEEAMRYGIAGFCKISLDYLRQVLPTPPRSPYCP